MGSPLSPPSSSSSVQPLSLSPSSKGAASSNSSRTVVGLGIASHGDSDDDGKTSSKLAVTSPYDLTNYVRVSRSDGAFVSDAS